MKRYNIAVIPGDGIGKEVTNEAVKVLNAVSEKHGFKVKTESFDWGCNYYLKHGEMGPENMLDILKPFDAIFLGCIGDANKVPDHVSLTLLLKIRKGFDQYVNLRPIKLYPGIETLIKTATPKTLDLIVVRENTEGEYAGAGGFFKLGTQMRLPSNCTFT
jgi:tartrate dehydrogenase/decarboxylase/D-malate dehydrogenase